MVERRLMSLPPLSTCALIPPAEHGPIPKVLFVTPRGKPELRSLSPMSVTSEGGLSEDSAASARRNGLEPGGSESREWTITIDPLQVCVHFLLVTT